MSRSHEARNLAGIIAELREQLAAARVNEARMRDRIERLRGLCKSAVGYLRDADAAGEANTITELIGDMEPALAEAK